MSEAADAATAWVLVCLVAGHGVMMVAAFVAVLLRLRELAARVDASREDLDDLETWSRSVEARWNRERERTH